MPDAPVVSPASRREQFDEVRAALAAPGAMAHRETLKSDIIALYRAIERDQGELATLKDAVKELVQQWKSLDDGTAPPSPPDVPLASPASVPVLDAVLVPAPVTPPAIIGAAVSGTARSSTLAAAPTTGSGAGSSRADHLNASTFLEKGWSLMSLGDPVGAEAALARALALSPEDPHGQSLLGWAQMLQEKYDDALLNFQKVLMREPQNSLARINVGYICLKKQIFGEAIEHLSKAIRLDNDRKATLYAHYYLGLLYLEREMYDDAQNFLRKAIALGPNLIEAHYELGRAIFLGGDREGAMSAWRDGARANKFSPWGKRCAEVLRQVEAGGALPRSS